MFWARTSQVRHRSDPFMLRGSAGGPCRAVPGGSTGLFETVPRRSIEEGHPRDAQESTVV